MISTNILLVVFAGLVLWLLWFKAPNKSSGTQIIVRLYEGDRLVAMRFAVCRIHHEHGKQIMESATFDIAVRQTHFIDRVTLALPEFPDVEAESPDFEGIEIGLNSGYMTLENKDEGILIVESKEE